MNKLISRSIASLLIVPAAFSAAALAAEKEIVAIYKSGTQQYFIDQADGFKAAAEKLGYKAKIINVETDSNLAISAVSDAIASGAKGIGITAPDQAIGPAVVAAAKEAGVYLIATDDPLKDADGNDVPFAGFDGVAMGDKVGERAAKLFTESGWLQNEKYGVLYVEVETLTVCVDRTTAARKRVAGAGAADDSFHLVPYEGTTDSALAVAAPVITANPEVDKWVVFACNDEGVLGTTNALKNAGFQPDDIIAVGLGAYEACRPWQANVPTAFKAALYLSGVDVGAAAAEALINSIETGAALPQNTVANTTIVDPTTFADIMPCN